MTSRHHTQRSPCDSLCRKHLKNVEEAVRTRSLDVTDDAPALIVHELDAHLGYATSGAWGMGMLALCGVPFCRSREIGAMEG